MSIRLTESVKKILIETALKLKGAEKRRFQAQTVMELGYGGSLLAQQELKWDRGTIKKGINELKTGITCVDNYSARGRKKLENYLPSLKSDIKSLVDSQSQTDPSFKSERLYTRLSVAEVRYQLIKQFGYTNQSLPTNETIRLKLNELKYCLKSVAKTKPKKKL
jgi:Rhodopirellula transposase DDE domain